MAKLPDSPVNVSIMDTDLFIDIVELLKEVSEKDKSILVRLMEIMNKHDSKYEYTICEECNPETKPLCTKECQKVCPECVGESCLMP